MSSGTATVTANLEVIESFYQLWRSDPDSVDPSWRFFFEGFELGASRLGAGPGAQAPAPPHGVVRLIHAYRELGHFLAHLDPLHEAPSQHSQLDLNVYGLSDADLDKTVDTRPFHGLGLARLRDLIAALRETYCRTIGVEYRHIQDTHIRHWLEERMEPTRNQPAFSRDRKIKILKSLHYAELFERFIHTRYSGQKRFSLEGGETLIPMLESIIERAPSTGVREIVMGMAHRGRLNVLANTLRKPYEEIFAQFEDKYVPQSVEGDGDVKYHLGFSSDWVTADGGNVHLSLTPNPSHLEAVNPVVEGRTRAKQSQFNDTERRHGVPLLIHGDAAFAGQGLVAETLNLSQLSGYTTGGTIHIVINNQIGFTTIPADARSSTYCTDVAKMVQAPIFHVNGEDPEAACFVAELALDFRQKFRRDVVIDLVCYRRHGHNESDEPSYTQPIMYSKIRARPSLTAVYTNQLTQTGELNPDECQSISQQFEDKLQKSLGEVKSGPPHYPIMRGFGGQWKSLAPHHSHAPIPTGVPEERLRHIADSLVVIPDGFNVQPKIHSLFQGYRQELLERKPVGWGFAEALAFGSLLLEGTPVRLSGQDCRRGTFSHRHSVYYDVKTAERYLPLNNLAPDQPAHYEVYDSLLSEAAVLGFEFGFSLDAPNTLVLWEAQFGDFANGAQVIIDQFIASSESKWQRHSGLVMLLPHGYEGQGPEHSSARIERYLQLCAEDNIQVAVPSTPGQYFHILRRQMRRNFRKPLIIMTPKSLLRDKLCVTPVSELAQGQFHDVLDDASVTDPSQVRRVVFCSGKVYYDLFRERNAQEASHVALVRLEQLYPFPEEALARVVSRYRKAKEWVWAQEESQNNGGWFFVSPRFEAMGFGDVRYVGRDASASPATGSHQVHVREQSDLVRAAIRGTIPHLVRAGSFLQPQSSTPAQSGPTAELRTPARVP